MAHATPTVHQGLLDTQESPQAIAVDSLAWFAWLSGHRVFRFVSPAGCFTARLERRAAGWYWYAYRRQRGSLRTAYLGKTSALTLARLTSTASTLNSTPVTPLQGAIPDVEAPEQRFLLATKILPPRLSSAILVRPRLMASLRKHADCKMLLVIGPAGSGKTVLLSAWAHELPHSVAWVSLDDGDNDPARFWSYVLAALQKPHPALAAHVLTLLPTVRPETMEQFLIPLINALAMLPDDVTLVLDDYHMVTNSLVQESVAFLLEHAPPRLHLAIASRSLPALPLPRLRAQGQLAELDFADLRFTQQEAAALFREVTGHLPEPEQIARMLADTEGWATGLYLSALASRGTPSSAAYPPVASVPPGDTRDNRYIVDYLASEIMAHQPAPVRDFLVRTSILDHLHGPLCDAVMLQDGSQYILQQLERENLFLSAMDERQGWFRYHQLFADFLRAQLEQNYPGHATVLHRRAAVWYARANLLAEAIAHALRAGDFALAAQFIERQGRGMLMRHEVLTLGAWLRALPEEVVLNRPRLCLFASWVLLHTSHTEPVERYLCAAEATLASVEVQAAQDVDERRGLHGEIAAIRARIAIYQDRTQQSVALSQQALTLLSESDHYMRGEVALSLATTSLLLDEIRAAEEAFCQASTLSWECSNLRAALLAVRSLANLYVSQGRLHRAYQLYEDSLERVHAIGQEQLPPVGFLYVGLGECCYQWNDLEAAECYASKSIELGQRGGDVKIWVLGYVLLMHTAQAQGKREQTWLLFSDAERLVRRASFIRGMEILHEVRARLGVMQDEMAPLLRWSEESRLDPAREPDASNEDGYYLLAQSLLARNEINTACGILHRLLERAQRTQCYGFAIAVYLSLARACASRGAYQSAFGALEEALFLAMPQNYRRIFLDEGPGLAQLLMKLLQVYQQGTRTPRPGVSDYLGELLKSVRHDLASQGSLGGITALAEQLSARELEVLHLLAAGHSNQQIAETLIIGVNTVKTHLRSIYGKLDAHNRTQAIAHARSLQVL